MIKVEVRCEWCDRIAILSVNVDRHRTFTCKDCGRTGELTWKELRADWLSSAMPPQTPEPKASSFASWVFEQSTPMQPQNEQTSLYRHTRLQLGVVTHQSIEQFMQFSWTQRFLSGHPPSAWKVLFSDDTDPPKRVFLASGLRVGGVPMACVPDLVLRNESTDTVLVIERKTTNLPEPNIPAEGWPNVEAQLWCYSMIDEWRDASEVLLVGQLWNRLRGGIRLCHTHPSWRRTDLDHDQRCRAWFGRYGGHVESVTQAASIRPRQ